MNTLNNSMLNKRKKGFTLTELAIVIAVIAILIAVLVPTFSSVITKARVSAAAQEATSAITAYTLETESGLEDGSVVAVDDTYYFEVNGNAVSTSNYNASISGLCPYQWNEDGDAYNSYNGKVVIYIDEPVVVFPSSYTITTNVTVNNSKLTITNSGSTYTITGTLGATDDSFKKWWNDDSTCPTSAFYFKAYIPAESSTITSINAKSSSGSNKTWYLSTDTTSSDSSRVTYQSLEDILAEDEDGSCYVEWVLSGTTKTYTITYNYTDGTEAKSGTITIYNNASQPV